MIYNIKSLVIRAIALIAGIIIILLLVFYAGVDNFFDRLIQANIWWVIASAIIYFTSWIFRTDRLSRLVRHAGKHIDSLSLFKFYISGFALNVLLPAKLGDIATIGFLRMNGISIGKSTAIIVQTRILDVIALITISMPLIALLTFGSTPAWLEISLMVSLFIVIFPIGIVTLDKQKQCKRFIKQIGSLLANDIWHKIFDKIADTYEGYHDILSDRKLLVITLILSIIIWLIDGLTCYVVSISVGANVAIMTCIFAVIVANIGKSVPATPGSIGVYEVMLAAIMVLMGVSPEISIIIAIIDHLIKNLVTMIIGLPMMLDIGAGITTSKV